MKIALTIAGSDSGGGAGIQADLKAFQRFGVFGASVITAVTAQNTLGVVAWQAVGLDLITAQIDAVATDLRPAAIKSGMLADTDVVQVVATGIRQHGLSPYILDPVMVATSGDLLLNRDAVESLISELIPLATLITPNIDEAVLLSGREITSVPQMRDAAKWLVEEGGANASLVKGGHLHGDSATDVMFDGHWHVFEHPRVITQHTHGTGCTLSAAVAAALALGDDLPRAVETALDYVHRAIETAPGLGGGHGPLNHFA